MPESPELRGFLLTLTVCSTTPTGLLRVQPIPVRWLQTHATFICDQQHLEITGSSG
jgi:hypothetical protein